MSPQEWFIVAVLAAMVFLLMRDLVAPSAAVLGATVVLLVAGIIDVRQAFSGFSNPAPITIAALYVLARSVEKTGALQPMLRRTMGPGGSDRRTLSRLLLPVTAASSFLNNTPIVAMLVPQVSEWAERRGISPSTLLMPLSFAAILGGLVTVIGTASNLIVSGLLQDHGFAPIGMFEVTRVGLPIAAAGMAALILLAPRLLPARRAARKELEPEQVRQFVVTMRVKEDGPLVGRTVADGGLRHLEGVFLVEVDRDGESIAPVTPETVLQPGDRLVFVGRADDVVDLQRMSGLESTEQEHMDHFRSARHTFYEVVLGADSPLLGTTLKEADFRGSYQAAVLAIHRAGQRVAGKLGEIPLRLGDTLLLLTDPGFGERWRNRNDFLLVSRLGGTPPLVSGKGWVVGLIAAGLVATASTGILPIVQAALVAAFALVATGVLTPGEARDAVQMDVIILIGAAFGLGAAVETSGLADRLAHGLVAGFSFLGAHGVLLGIVLAVTILKEFITKNAAAVLVFPIALASAEQIGADPRVFALGLMLAAATSFMTPIGYQTNTMVYGPGGYRFGDYARLGLPLTILVMAGIVLLVPVVWPF
ncbi:MAG: SLC13 family permease [bacterium]